MNLRYDYDQLVWAELAEHGYSESSKDDDLGRQLDLYDLKARMVPVRRYRVHLSREIASNPRLPELGSTVDELIERMRTGLPLAPYLSTLATRLKHRDHLLVHWGLHHAHLSPLSTLKTDGYVVRADYLLFFWVDRGDIYLVEIVPHGDNEAFEREELVGIVDRNVIFNHRISTRDWEVLITYLMSKPISRAWRASEGRSRGRECAFSATQSCKLMRAFGVQMHHQVRKRMGAPS